MPHSEGARSHFLPIFTDNLGELLDCHFIGSIILQVHVVDSSSGFCSKIVLERNCYIQSVALDEGNSVVLLPGRLESPGVEFLKLVDNQ